MDDDGALRMAKMVAEMQLFFMEADRLKVPDSPARRVLDLARWRKFRAISRVSLELPIGRTRFFPECIALAWYFGLELFWRDRNQLLYRRVPAEDGEPSDEKWTAMVEKIRKGVLEAIAEVK